MIKYPDEPYKQLLWSPDGYKLKLKVDDEIFQACSDFSKIH